MTKAKATPETGPAQSADELALICVRCQKPGTIRIASSRGATLPLEVSCSKALGGCGRWFHCGSRLVEDGGEV